MRRCWFRQARTPLPTACGKVAKPGRCCPPRPSRRFATRTMEQCTLHFQGTLAFCPHTLRKSSSFVFLMFLVQGLGNKDHTSKQKLPEEAPPAPRSAEQPDDALPWEPVGPQGTASFWERTEAPLPPLPPKCNFIHPKQLSPFPDQKRSCQGSKVLSLRSQTSSPRG